MTVESEFSQIPLLLRCQDEQQSSKNHARSIRSPSGYRKVIGAKLVQFRETESSQVSNRSTRFQKGQLLLLEGCVSAQILLNFSKFSKKFIFYLICKKQTDKKYPSLFSVIIQNISFCRVNSAFIESATLPSLLCTEMF